MRCALYAKECMADNTLNLICSNPTLPVIPGWRGRLILVRFCSEAVASMAATLASAIEWTIESPG